LRRSRRDEVLQAALGLLDEVGLDALTTRRLGVRPGALYRHFDSEQALLNAMVDAVVSGGSGDGPPRPADGTWDEQIRTIATGARAAMLTHRDGARLGSPTWCPVRVPSRARRSSPGNGCWPSCNRQVCRTRAR
jgi:TetR/AcrR family tetracycline transcriptional repressor